MSDDLLKISFGRQAALVSIETIQTSIHARGSVFKAWIATRLVKRSAGCSETNHLVHLEISL
jgi:hypothetical protein